MRNPSVGFGDQTLRFTGEINPGEYIEYDPSNATAAVFNRLGFVRNIEFSGALTLPEGDSELTFSAEASGTRRIKAHLMVSSLPFENK